jgi:AcrR family transcriptional regulator
MAWSIGNPCLPLDPFLPLGYSKLMTDRSVTKKRRRRPEARPGEILAAALELFSKKGFSATRMDEVAARAGVSKGAVYLYFPDKTALLKALVKQATGGQITEVAQLAESLNGPVAPLLRQLIAQIAHRIETTKLPSIVKLVIAESRAHPAIGKFYLDNVIRTALPILERLIQRGVTSGEFRAVNAQLAAKCLMGPMLLSVIWRSVFQPLGAEAMDIKALASQHADLFLGGLKP